MKVETKFSETPISNGDVESLHEEVQIEVPDSGIVTAKIATVFLEQNSESFDESVSPSPDKPIPVDHVLEYDEGSLSEEIAAVFEEEKTNQ